VYNYLRRDNMVKVKSNLQPILDERKISVLKLSKDIEYRYESVRKMYNDEIEHFPKALILKICTYLNVTPGDLIIIENDNPDC
jgi:DNA-binding Xre family transcriptional regulator